MDALKRTRLCKLLARIDDAFTECLEKIRECPHQIYNCVIVWTGCSSEFIRAAWYLRESGLTPDAAALFTHYEMFWDHLGDVLYSDVADVDPEMADFFEEKYGPYHRSDIEGPFYDETQEKRHQSIVVESLELLDCVRELRSHFELEPVTKTVELEAPKVTETDGSAQKGDGSRYDALDEQKPPSATGRQAMNVPHPKEVHTAAYWQNGDRSKSEGGGEGEGGGSRQIPPDSGPVTLDRNPPVTIEGNERVENAANEDDSLPAKRRKLAPSRVKAAAIHDWAMSRIPGADSMTISELYDAIEAHPSDASEALAPNVETFGRYLRDAGVKRYSSRADKANTTVRRESDL